MPGIFIISLDCEGKWGAADHINNHHEHHPRWFSSNTFTNARLNQVYRNILNILNKEEIKGTFAFVGAFTMSFEEYQANSDWFSDVFIGGQNWFSKFNQSMRANNFDGWLNPDAYEMVINEKSHEVASHGFSHHPLQSELITKSRFLKEMGLIKLVSRLKGMEPKTFIYPRNITGYIDQLGNSGFLGYRNGTEQFPKPISRINNLLREFNIFDRAQPVSTRTQTKLPICIPSGHFLNWRRGLRKKVPMNITLKKYDHIINDAIQNNRVLHLWTHPHNFIDG
ncbi:uncharacterized protein METZ01_LOCUS360498, partial [marine metagenome]